jgi:hypothetical protein
MEDFLYIFRGGDARDASQSPELMQQHMQKWMKWMEELGKNGRLVGGEPLHMEGAVVKGGGKVITDGPYAEGKELVGGYLIVKASNLKEAAELSKECPIFEYDGTVEVRPIQKMEM